MGKLPRIVGHVLGQISQQNSQVETDFLSGIVEPLSEFDIVDLAIVIRVATGQHEIDLISSWTNERIKCLYMGE